MNLENLKNGFDLLLKKDPAKDSRISDGTAGQNDNIFNCYEEFKDYLFQQTGINPEDLSGNIDDIKELDVIDGQVQNNQNKLGVNALFIDIINEAISNKDVIKAYDSDNSGFLTEEEVSSFYNAILEDGESEITFDSLAKGVNTASEENVLDSYYSNLDNTALSAARAEYVEKLKDGKLKTELICENKGEASGIYSEKTAVEITYKNAVNNDSNLDDKTKESVLENIEALNSKKDEISEVKLNLFNYDVKIENAQYQKELNEKKISDIEQELEDFRAEGENQENYEDKKASLENKLKIANELKKQAQEFIEQTKEKKEKEEQNLDNKILELDKLKQDNENISKTVAQNASEETRNQLELYNKALNYFDTSKENLFNASKEEYKKTRNEFEAIDKESIERGLRNSFNVFLNPDDGEEFLEELSHYGGDAPSRIGDLSSVFGLSDEETGAYLTALANSPQWGSGCIEPVVLFAQICQESDFNPDVVDINNGGESLGLGQFKQIAVDQVNKVYKTDYSYDDRANPIKSTEMMVLFLKYCFEQTNSSYGALAMYNQGSPDAIYTSGGVQYIRDVLNRIGIEYNG